MTKDSKGRSDPNDPLEFEDVRDEKGKLLGRITSKNYMGVRQVTDSKGHTVGYSKDASDMGGLPHTTDNKGKRVSHGEHPELLLGREDKKRSAEDDLDDHLRWKRNR
jgi:hypothetical protein